jgi:hypothetical protein
MKSVLMTISFAAILALATAAFAGPNVASTSYRNGTFGMQADKMKVEARPYALTGRNAEAKPFHWKTSLKWVGGQRQRVIVFERVYE